jgi:hypothetical protein
MQPDLLGVARIKITASLAIALSPHYVAVAVAVAKALLLIRVPPLQLQPYSFEHSLHDRFPSALASSFIIFLQNTQGFEASGATLCPRFNSKRLSLVSQLGRLSIMNGSPCSSQAWCWHEADQVVLPRQRLNIKVARDYLAEHRIGICSVRRLTYGITGAGKLGTWA